MTERLTNEQLEAIRKRVEKATEGPWQLADTYDGAWVLDEDDDIISGTVSRNDDAKFIAHAREDVPALLAEIVRLQAESTYWRMERNHERGQAEMYREKYLRTKAKVDKLTGIIYEHGCEIDLGGDSE